MFYGAGCKQSKYLPDCAGTKPFEEYLTMTVGDPWPRIDDETHALLPKKVLEKCRLRPLFTALSVVCTTRPRTSRNASVN